MGPTGKIVIAFLGGIAIAVVGLHVIWQMHSKGDVDLSGWIAAYERAFPPTGSAQRTESGGDLAQRVAQLEQRISSLENALPARRESTSGEQPAADVAAVPARTKEAAGDGGPYDIQVLNWEWSPDRGNHRYIAVAGLVRNISGQSQKHVRASVEWYDKQNKFLTSKVNSVSLDPLPPGETATFRISILRDPRMHSARLRFQTILGKGLSSAESVQTETPLSE